MSARAATQAGSGNAVAVFGGTFNPVHYGHMRSAIELVEHLQLHHLDLMPCAQPVHREQPGCSAEHRAAMVELAVAGEPRLGCDRRELERQGPSYSYDSLVDIRQDLGPQRGLCLVMGCDAIQTIDTWHRWRDLLDVAHVIVIARPGWALPNEGVVAQWLQAHRCTDPAQLHRQACGLVHVEELRPLAISSTEIRSLLQLGQSVRYLLPEPVLDYIDQHDLYRQKERTA